MEKLSIDRRTFLAATTSALFLGACGSSGPKPDRLGFRFPDGFRQASVAVTGTKQRFPFVIIADDGFPMTTGAPEEISIEVLHNGEVVEQQSVAARGSGQLIPYYPLTFVPAAAGNYTARANVSDVDSDFQVVERGDTTLFQVGDPLPGFTTPTTLDPAGVATICTRTEQCPFHEISLDEALDNGRPTAMLIATPAFCQTDVCGPNVEWLIELAASRAGDINVIHAEVYEDFQRDVDAGGLPTRAPMLEAWDVAFEPSLFVVGGDGVIVDALHFAFDREEMADALAQI